MGLREDNDNRLADFEWRITKIELQLEHMLTALTAMESALRLLNGEKTNTAYNHNIPDHRPD